ncbi:ORFL82W [Human betaherpesvirus 5]|nr:ORFL82W [Human betaherpesvirus 5]QHX40393.1 ORFL82W [Human betaherpesvirus 5]
MVGMHQGHVRLQTRADGFVHRVAADHALGKKSGQIRGQLVQAVLLRVVGEHGAVRVHEHLVPAGGVRDRANEMQSSEFAEKVVLAVLQIDLGQRVRRMLAPDHVDALRGPAQRHARALEAPQVTPQALIVASHAQVGQVARAKDLGYQAAFATRPTRVPRQRRKARRRRRRGGRRRGRRAALATAGHAGSPRRSTGDKKAEAAVASATRSTPSSTRSAATERRGAPLLGFL